MVKSHSNPFFILVWFSLLCIAASSVAIQLYNDPIFLDSEIRRIRAGKAGTPLRPPVPRGQQTVTSGEDGDEDMEESSGGGEDDDEDTIYTTSEEIDYTCAPGKGWYYRGQRCVPLKCPGGDNKRDFNTGECLHGPKTQPAGRFKPYSQWNSLNHVYKTHPAQRFLSRGMMSMLRRG